MLPYINGLIHLVVQHVERWVCTAGLTPLAIGLTEGALIAAELATVVIGGLFTSTFLTLLIVPVMYSLLDRISTRRRRKT